jgi:hypothetical protein
VTHVAERILSLLQHLMPEGDEENATLLEGLVYGIGDSAERLGVLAYGNEDGTIPPGEALSNPAVAPAWALPHAALYTGGIVPGRMAGESEAAWLARARDAVVYPSGMRRGSHRAVQLAAAPFLTGTKQVVILDVEPTDPYSLVVRVRESEVVDADAVRLAIEGGYISGGARGAIRAEQVLTLIVADDPVWLEVDETLTWAADVPAGVSWDEFDFETLT